MQITLLQIRAFVAVSRFGGFTLAADALGRTQPAITAQVKQLEQALGLVLFDRSTRRLRLTSVGSELATAYSRIIDDLDRVVETSRQLRNMDSGIVRIACMPSIAATVLPARIAAFRKRFPMISFSITDAVGKRVSELVTQAEVEFGIMDMVPGTVDLQAIPLLKDTMRVFFLAGHPIEAAKKVDTRELCRHDLILSMPGSNLRRMIDRAFASTGREAFAACEVTDTRTAVGLVRAGLGVAMLPLSCVDMELDKRLRFRELHGPGFERQVAIVKLRNRTLSPAAEAFAQELSSMGANEGFAVTRTPRSRRTAQPSSGGRLRKGIKAKSRTAV